MFSRPNEEGLEDNRESVAVEKALGAFLNIYLERDKIWKIDIFAHFKSASFKNIILPRTY